MMRPSVVPGVIVVLVIRIISSLTARVVVDIIPKTFEESWSPQHVDLRENPGLALLGS
jgi:hypothetical protein